MNDVLLISLCTLSVIGLSILIIMFMENGFNKWVYILHIPIVIILWTLFAFIPDRPEVEYRYHKIYNVGDSQASVAYTKKGKKYIDILEETNSVANPEEQALKEIIHGDWVCGVYRASSKDDAGIDKTTWYELAPINSTEQPKLSDPHTAIWQWIFYSLMILPPIPVYFWYRRYKYRQDNKNLCVECKKLVISAYDVITIDTMKTGTSVVMHPECAIKFLVKGWDKRLADPDSLE